MSSKDKMDQAYRQGRACGEALRASSRRMYDQLHALAAAAEMPAQRLSDYVVAFDAERLDAVPDLTVYPELRGHRDRLDAQDRGKLDGGASRELIALERSLEFFRLNRLPPIVGHVCYAEAAAVEKCRVLYLPQTQVGAVHAKNVDDPAEYFVPHPPIAPQSPWPMSGPLVFDGVGSGLHIDEAPPEIFPVQVTALCREHRTDVRSATEFMVRYNYFWTAQNLLIHDHQGNSVSFEKTNCRVAVHGPDAKGRHFISGMTAKDEQIRALHRRMRQQYLDEIGDDWNGPDACFWRTCDRTWQHMAAYVEALSDNPSLNDVMSLMSRCDPDGPLCFTGEKSHPKQRVTAWTLVMDVYLMEHRQLLRRQYRDGRSAYLDDVERVQFR